MSFDRDGYEALKSMAGNPENGKISVQADAFRFLMNAFAEQRLAIRALNDRVKALETSRSGDERLGEFQRPDNDDPAALEVW